VITESCDVLVIGGGHAGTEAAWAAANLGARTVLLTHARDAIGRMSCNPAIGGIGKGQIVREVDALGGLMGLVTDETGLQFRMLNRGKGPAVWAPRAQADRERYAAAVQRHLERCPNLTIIEGGADEIVATPHASADHDKRVTGVTLTIGQTVHAAAVVLAAGTFLRGLMHTGKQQTPGGRVGEPAATQLSDSLRALGLQLGRLKTGTSPRIARASIDFSRLKEQPGDERPSPFSFMTDRINQVQVCCWLTATTPESHELIRANLEQAPLYTGQIQSTGPRYCPSIETKVVRFPDKTSHQIFLEPEGRDSDRVYVNGLSTSLPIEVQSRLVALIPGLERARIVQWGYAIEYDFVPPEQIDATLETKRIAGLFLAGQINGTSGYEEAAGQGIVAGINAARFVAGLEPIIIGRDEGYIGVMIDDLVTRGVTEPYRMFSSRAEHRMHLRYDNADTRLTPLGRRIGLVKDTRWERYCATRERLQSLLATIARVRVDGVTLRDWLKRPDENGERFRAFAPEISDLTADEEVWDRARVIAKYDGYIERQSRMIAQFRELESCPIPVGTDYGCIQHLRREAVERWSAVRPRSVGQASRVSGIHPTDINVLLVYLHAQAGRGVRSGKNAHDMQS
jgi:tRNA uridine 5-carboxymethylaminomethyl modification enzyme